MSARLRQRAPMWAWRQGEDPSLLWKLFFEQGEQVVALVALFWARRKREGGHAPLVMYRDLAWASSDATHTHEYRDGHTITI